MATSIYVLVMLTFAGGEIQTRSDLYRLTSAADCIIAMRDHGEEYKEEIEEGYITFQCEEKR
jgi:hypothetical protein